MEDEEEHEYEVEVGEEETETGQVTNINSLKPKKLKVLKRRSLVE